MNIRDLNPELKAHYEKYSILSEGYDSISLSYLASAVNMSENKVIKELHFLIINGFFGKDAYINYNTRKLVLRNTPVRPSENRSSERASAQPKKQGGDTKKSGPLTVLAEYAPKKSGQTWLLIGSILCFLGCVGYIDSTVVSFSAGTVIAAVWELIKAIVFGLGGGVLLTLRFGNRSRALRFHRYAKFLKGKKAVTFTELAATADTSLNTVCRDVKKLTDSGLLGEEAYFDHLGGTLYLTADAQSEENANREKAENVASGGNSQYYDIICEIRRLNDEIQDVPVSDRIDKIEDLTSKIFRVVEENKDKEPQIKSFMSYYLPTTLKLLRTYSTLERQGIGGENIEAAKKDIERILDTLIKGFAQQLDRLFTDEVIDISTDIEVLETMMKRDDLSGKSGMSI